MIRLALSLGWSIQDVKDHISCPELQEWRAYYEIEPFGEYRADLRAGIIASTIANCWSSKEHKPADFMPDFEGEEPTGQSVAEMQARMRLSLTVAKAERKDHGKHVGPRCQLNGENR